MKNVEYAEDWYKQGKKSKDPVFKFMMYWVAFNWLYNEVREGDEPARIRTFCKKHIEELSGFDAFENGAIFIFEDGPVKDMRYADSDDEESESYGNGRPLYGGAASRRRKFKGTDLEKIRKLILEIYRVRCNLFHGSKKLISLKDPRSRDSQLVRSSAIIMEGYLKKLLEID